MKKLTPIFVLLFAVALFCGCAANSSLSASSEKCNTENKFGSEEQIIAVENRQEEIDDSQETANDNQEVIEDRQEEIEGEKEPEIVLTFAQRVKNVVEYICNNYEEYAGYTRYVDFGTENLVNAATNEEKLLIEQYTIILEEAIAENVSLAQPEWEAASGAAKAVQDLDTALYPIWYREITKN